MLPQIGPAFLMDSSQRILSCNEAFFSQFPELRDQTPLCSLDTFWEKYGSDYTLFQISAADLMSTMQTDKAAAFQDGSLCLLVPKNNAFFEKVLEHLYDCVFVCDEQGIVLYVNKTFEKYYGIRRDEILGRRGINFLGNYQCTASPIPLVLEERRTVTMEQTTYVNRTVTITAVPVFDERQNIEMIVENSRDITEIGHLKESLKEMSLLAEQYKSAATHMGNPGEPMTILANSSAMKKIMNSVQRVAGVDSTIMLLGESGTGKSHLARYIHSISNRKDNPFITINCSTIPEALFESELFGYLPGTFTGANKNGKIGLVELADSGTLFLDEVGELPPLIQTKMLQLVQEHSFIPVGGTKEKRIDIRIIAATNEDLEKLVAEKRFREDLYYRLKVVEFELPPLRERKEDLLVLIYHFFNLFDKKYRFSHTLHPETMQAFQQYHWPGNIRELSNVIENLVVMVESGEILPEDLPPSLYKSPQARYRPAVQEINSLADELEKVEAAIIREAYLELKSSYKVAEKLGISQSKASRKIKKYCHVTEEPGIVKR